MPNEQVDSLKGAFTNDNVPAADRTVALAQNPGVVELGYYVKGAPLILDVSCYVPGNPKETVSVERGTAAGTSAGDSLFGSGRESVGIWRVQRRD